MTSLRPLLALTLPVVFVAGCASTPATDAAPKTKTSVSIDKEADGRDIYANETPEVPAPAEADTDGGATTATGDDATTDDADTTEVGASGGARKKIVYNNSKPKGFKRYNAGGVVNVNKYLYPKNDIFGVFTDQAKDQIAARNAIGKKVGKKPNMIKSFYNWGNPFSVDWAKRIWANGAFPQFELELQNPDDATLASIAAGQEDEYIRALALGIRASNVPVVFSPFHEFNGDWYQWGYCGPTSKPDTNACKVKNTPAQFKAAWKRMHDIFKAVGATNAIWLWQANQTGARPQVGLKQFYPGNSYVDWVGVVGYYYHQNNWYHTWNTLFLPTIKQMKKFTSKPILIPEMGMEPGKNRPADIKNFLKAVASRKDVIGFLWFSYNKPTEMDFRIDSSAASTKAFKTWINSNAFGYDPRKVK